MPIANPLPQYALETPELGYPLAYTASGAAGGPPFSRTPLILVHGSLCDYRYWRWQMPALGQERPVLAPSLRGFWPSAFSAADASFSIARHVRDLIEFIRRAAGGRPVHLLGHSRGAHVVLELGCTAPELMKSMILADPGFRIAGDPDVPAFQLEVVEKLERGDLEAAMAQFVDTVNGAGTWRRMVGWFKAMVRDNAYTLLSQVRESGLRFDLTRVRQIDCPVLLLGGADSPSTYRRRIDSLEPLFTRVERATIPLASHGMNLANPRAFNDRVLEFLKSGG